RLASAVHLCAFTCGRRRSPGSASDIASRLCWNAPASTRRAGVTRSWIPFAMAEHATRAGERGDARAHQANAQGVGDREAALDPQLSVDDGAVAQLVPGLRAMADEAGTVIAAFPADHIGLPHMLIVLYDDLVHVDFEPVQVSEVGSRNAGLRTRVLWERNPAVSAGLGA